MDEWLVGWKAIGKYVGRSAKTAQRWAMEGMPFCRDPGGRPIAKRSQIDDYIFSMNQEQYDDKIWKDEGIHTALSFERDREQQRKDFNERLILAQRPTRSRF